jgi:hypothetical protein
MEVGRPGLGRPAGRLLPCLKASVSCFLFSVEGAVRFLFPVTVPKPLPLPRKQRRPVKLNVRHVRTVRYLSAAAHTMHESKAPTAGTHGSVPVTAADTVRALSCRRLHSGPCLRCVRCTLVLADAEVDWWRRAAAEPDIVPTDWRWGGT